MSKMDNYHFNSDNNDLHQSEIQSNKCRLFEQNDESNERSSPSSLIDDQIIEEILDNILAHNNLKKLSLDKLFKKINEHLNDQFGRVGYRKPTRIMIMKMINKRLNRMTRNELNAIQSGSTNFPTPSSSSLIEGMIFTNNKFSLKQYKKRKLFQFDNAVFQLD